MASHGAKRSRDKVVEPTIPDGFGEFGSPEFDKLNRHDHGNGPTGSALLRVGALKRRYRDHVKHYNPWQLIGDRTQDTWQYLASPLSQHGPVVPPSYGELEKIERELVWLFSHSNWADPSATDAAEASVAAYEKQFEKFDHDSKNGREVAGAIAEFAAIAPSVPFLVSGAPVTAGVVAALGAAATHTAIEANDKAIEGTTLSWRELAPEAVKAGGAAFLSVFVWAKLSPYLVAKLPGCVAAGIPDKQLLWIAKKLGRELTRDQLRHALIQFGAEFWANVLSAGTATSFELTFDLLRSKQEMTLAEFTSALAANMLTVAGLQVLVAALTHTKSWARSKAKKNSAPAEKTSAPDEFDEPMQTQVEQLLSRQRGNHPHLAEPVPWHGTEPLELPGSTRADKPAKLNTSEALPHYEVERIMARHRACAHDNFSPDEADLIIRDLENWRQHPITDPHTRRNEVDATAFLSRAQWFHDEMTIALRDKRAQNSIRNPQFEKQANTAIGKARTILAGGKMSLAELESLRDLYLDATGNWHDLDLKSSQHLQTPTLLNDRHFGERSNNAAGAVDVHQAGLLGPNEYFAGFYSGTMTTHDYRHTGRLSTEYAPAFHSYLAAVDRRIDFAEAIGGFAKLLSSREQQLLESVRFAARWENGFAPTPEHTWGATRSSTNWVGNDRNLVQASIRVEYEKGNTVSPQEMEQVVAKFRTFIANYLRWLPDGELRKRNALFAEKLSQHAVDHWEKKAGGIQWWFVAELLGQRTSAATSAAQLALSPEEVMAILRVDPKAPREPTLATYFSLKETDGFRQFVQDFISEHPLPGH